MVCCHPGAWRAILGLPSAKVSLKKMTFNFRMVPSDPAGLTPGRPDEGVWAYVCLRRGRRPVCPAERSSALGILARQHRLLCQLADEFGDASLVVAWQEQ
jgi:hypothetical protein